MQNDTFSNSLAKEKSPYLLQHAHNPVQWLPWGPEAFERARTLQRPIFLSIGYSTCHWCHVMAHESFEDPAVARILNEGFVCIKVDREERPDVDRLYMSFVQATTGSGGWPMSVWLTPDLKPFYGGTYFPPVDRFGRIGFPTLLKRIQEAWNKDREGIVKTAGETLQELISSASLAGGSGDLSAAPLEAGFQALLRQYDAEEGGFGKAPKFPRPSTLHFLLRQAKRAGAGTADSQIASGMVLHTLRAMANGGMNDQLAGGFHRYSVDRVWHVPHYEKMLYDQAQLVCAHIEAFQLSGDSFFAQIAGQTLDYVQRDMTAPEGGFYSAEDADSLLSHGSKEHAEGAFYVWTQSEIESVLGPEAPFFCAVYGVLREGNSPKGSDPHGELTGKNTLIRKLPPTEAARLANAAESETETRLAGCRALLLTQRHGRPRPHRDDKILTAWNGLMISAFAQGYAVLENPAYLATAQKAALFLKQNLWKDRRLLRSFRGEPSNVHGFAEDYAFLIQAFLDLYEADFDPGWIQFAIQLQTRQDELFLDAKNGAYFASESGDSSVLIRMKEDHDGAEPAASSVAARNLLRLAELTGNSAYRDRAEKTIRAFSTILQQAPTSLPGMLCSLDQLLAPAQQIVFAGDLTQADTQSLLRTVRRSFLPHKNLLHPGPTAAQAELGERFTQIQAMQPVKGSATAYVCENFVCHAPVTDPKELEALLKKK
jgi:hypothetical protein